MSPFDLVAGFLAGMLGGVAPYLVPTKHRLPKWARAMEAK